MSFVHLRVHSEFSLADGIVKVDRLADRAAAAGMPAVALTDRTNLFGLIKFYQACLQRGIKPVIGADLRFCDSNADADNDFRCTVLAADQRGYGNLITLVSRAHQRGERRGLVERSWLAECNAGLILLSGADKGDVGQALLRGQGERAAALARAWQSDFGDRFYLELVRTDRTGEGPYVADAVALAAVLDIPVVATNDVCFLDSGDYEAHETRVCIHEGRALNDPRRVRRYSDQQYLRTPEEMAERFRDLPAALENAVEIAKRCNVELKLGTYYLPEYPLPAGTSFEAYLDERAREGLKRRLAQLPPKEGTEPRTYDERLETELGIIKQMGFAGYFLIVMEFIDWARTNGIPVGPGRGSGVGSLVAYSLGITGIDPLAYDLLFERLLNPERVSMPDFDVDFCMEGRDRVIEHVADRYGHDAVSQIVTFGTMAAKAVVRDVARVQGKPYWLADKLSKLIPFEVGMTLDKAVRETAELRQFIDENEDVAEIMEMAYKLEGVVRNVGRHAGGVVIAPSTLTDFVPLFVDDSSGGLVSQFDKDDVEHAGLVKFDFLGLKTLTIIDWAVQSINALRTDGGEPALDIETLPMNDPATFELLRRGDSTAVFQLESRGMKELIRRLQPDTFEDLIAILALFRPGPLQAGMADEYIDRKHGRTRVEYAHPSLEPVLGNTYGTILYQEQVMQIAQVLAGYTLGQADLLRRAMGKKKPEEMAQQRELFTTGARKRNVAPALANHIFDQMEVFAGYAFNKSHSAAYALISYQTAWLKVHYPAQFMAAVLSVDMQNTDKIVVFVDEVSRMGLTLLAPCVNRSEYRFTAAAGTVVYGLGAVKGVGEGPVAAIVSSRRRGGDFRDLTDFCLRVEGRKANRRVLEALIRAGAMDCFAGTNESMDAVRARLLAELPDGLQRAEQTARDAENGITDLFGGVARPTAAAPQPRAAVVPLSRRERLTAEKETLGLFLTGHPIDDYIDEIRRFCPRPIADLRPERGNQIVAGLVVSMRTMRGKRGDTLAFAVLDDRSDRVEVSLFSDVFEQHKMKLDKDAVVVIEGDVARDDYTDGCKVRVSTVYTMDEARQRFADCLEIKLSCDALGQDFARRLKRMLKPHCRQGCPVAVAYRGAAAEGRLVLGPDWQVAPTDELLAELRGEFGAEQVSVSYRV
jgi:DNA polymerase III subunit alpha